MPTISFGSNEPEVKVTDTVEDTIESKTEDTVEYNSETSSSETMKIDLGVDVPVEAISKFGYLDYDTILFAQQQAQDAGLDTEVTGCINGQREWVTSQPGIIKVNEDSSDPVWLDSGEPSKFVMLLQKKFGLDETGIFDKDLWHMFEVRYGKRIDNWIDSPSETVAAWQNELNAGSFFK